MVARGAAEAREILRQAAGRPVLLLSAPGAAGMLGAPGWRALLARAAEAVPDACFADALCCGAAPGQALAALRAGCRILVLDGACPAFPAVAAASAAAGARLLPARPKALDAQELDLRRPAGQARLAHWLAAQTDDSAPFRR
ncbi:hypothetical protein [Falsiroseomonas sp.]|uniref:hypothetical protein n=1 Tax=Falsiroseomonas sp. TaxID=2870721 RepID=UPI0035689CCD